MALNHWTGPMEFGQNENQSGGFYRRRKGGLETPLVGRSAKEGRRLLFAPPQWYDALVACSVFGGGALLLYGFMVGEGFYTFLGTSVGLSGIWAALSNERMTCNLTDRTYRRIEGKGLRKRVLQGRVDDLDAVVLITEVSPFLLPAAQAVTYRLVLHWKGAKQPLLVVGRESHTLAGNAPMNSSAGRMAQLGAAYAQSLGVRFFDNSYFQSGSPVPLA